MTAADDLDQVIEQYHQALDEIVKGSADGYKRSYSHTDDVTLANPFGPPVRGWDEVAEASDRAASQLRDGQTLGFEIVAKYTTAELAYVVQIERVKAKIGRSEDMTPFDLRVTNGLQARRRR